MSRTRNGPSVKATIALVHACDRAAVRHRHRAFAQSALPCDSYVSGITLQGLRLYVYGVPRYVGISGDQDGCAQLRLQLLP